MKITMNLIVECPNCKKGTLIITEPLVQRELQNYHQFSKICTSCLSTITMVLDVRLAQWEAKALPKL